MNQIVAGGKIEMIIGPMFSGKSTELINSVNRYKHKNKNTILVKYAQDTRYTEGAKVVTHDKYLFFHLYFRQESPALTTSFLREIFDELMLYDVIGIDEGQFYTDVN
jgi:thymidine kinase